MIFFVLKPTIQLVKKWWLENGCFLKHKYPAIGYSIINLNQLKVFIFVYFIWIGLYYETTRSYKNSNKHYCFTADWRISIPGFIIHTSKSQATIRQFIASNTSISYCVLVIWTSFVSNVSEFHVSKARTSYNFCKRIQR